MLNQQYKLLWDNKCLAWWWKSSGYSTLMLRKGVFCIHHLGRTMRGNCKQSSQSRERWSVKQRLVGGHQQSMPGVDTGSKCIQNPGTSHTRKSWETWSQEKAQGSNLINAFKYPKRACKMGLGPFLCAQWQGKRHTMQQRKFPLNTRRF